MKSINLARQNFWAPLYYEFHLEWVGDSYSGQYDIIYTADNTNTSIRLFITAYHNRHNIQHSLNIETSSRSGTLFAARQLNFGPWQPP
jgi:hypothetical protein